MDFRKDYSKPGEAPYQPTVAKYTDNWILLISSSKSFSYAGQRIGMMVISNALFTKEYASLKKELGNPSFGHNLIYKVLYSLSSGVTHSAQYGLAAMLKAVNNGSFDFVAQVKIYGERAKIMKKLFKRKSGKRGPVRAKKVSYDGINFASGLEKYMYIALRKAKIKAKYEGETFVLLNGFHFENPTLHMVIGVSAVLFIPIFIYKTAMRVHFPYLFEPGKVATRAGL